MKKARFTEGQIIRILQEAVAGRPIRELCRHHAITETTFYRWRHKYGGLQLSEAKRLKALGTRIGA
jgi:putative transposase